MRWRVGAVVAREVGSSGVRAMRGLHVAAARLGHDLVRGRGRGRVRGRVHWYHLEHPR